MPEDKHSPVVFFGPKDTINDHLLRLYHILKKKSPREFEKMEKSLVFEFPDSEHFRHASSQLDTIHSKSGVSNVNNYLINTSNLITLFKTQKVKNVTIIVPIVNCILLIFLFIYIHLYMFV